MPDTAELLSMLKEGDHLSPAAAQSSIPMGHAQAYETIKRELTSFLGTIAGSKFGCSQIVLQVPRSHVRLPHVTG